MEYHQVISLDDVKNEIEFEDIRFIKLETNPDILLGNDIFLKISEDKIFILDKDYQKCVLCYSNVGIFLSKIGKKGKGPGEYIEIRDFIIKNDAHLITVLRYVENNPVRAQLVQSAEDWPWSSLAERFGNKKVLLDESPVELPTNWRDYVNKFLNDEEINRLRNSVKRQAPFGDSMWQSEICRELGLGSTISPRGRPKR